MKMIDGYMRMTDDVGLSWDEWDTPERRKEVDAAFGLARLAQTCQYAEWADYLTKAYGLDGTVPFDDERLRREFAGRVKNSRNRAGLCPCDGLILFHLIAYRLAAIEALRLADDGPKHWGELESSTEFALEGVEPLGENSGWYLVGPYESGLVEDLVERGYLTTGPGGQIAWDDPQASADDLSCTVQITDAGRKLLAYLEASQA